MSTCKACGATFRKGVLAFLLTPAGLKGARVCQSCASGGVLLVAPKLAPVVQKKVVRGDGVERAMRRLRGYAAGSRAAAGAADKDDEALPHIRGRIGGLEEAIEVLKRECGE